MEQKTHPIHRSQKSVLNLEDIILTRKYIFPSNLANDRTEIGPIIYVQRGIKRWDIPTGKVVTIDNDVFSILSDSGYSPGKYEVDGEEDPLHE